jgi:hypothetical protein
VDRRWRKPDHIPWLLGIGIVLYVVLRPSHGLVVVTLLNLGLLLFWVLFLMPTKCDFEVDGRGCRRDVYGKLRGCTWHARDKRDALFALFGMRNPGAAVRVTWLDGADPGKSVGHGRAKSQVDTADQAANRSQALYNAVSLFVATVGSVAGVLALFIGPD